MAIIENVSFRSLDVLVSIVKAKLSRVAGRYGGPAF